MGWPSSTPPLTQSTEMEGKPLLDQQGQMLSKSEDWKVVSTTEYSISKAALGRKRDRDAWETTSFPPSDDMEKPGSHRRYPCRARGISDNHTNRTAYFDVPLNAAHGLQLVCSHDVCAKSGRIFRYCTVCALPCAKRNFAKRHSHGLKIIPSPQVLSKTKTLRIINKGEMAVSSTFEDNITFPSSSSISEQSQSTRQLRICEGRLDLSSNNSTLHHPIPKEESTRTFVPGNNYSRLELFQNRPTTSDVTATSRWIKSIRSLSVPRSPALSSLSESVNRVNDSVRNAEVDAMREFGNLCWAEEDFDTLFSEEV